MTQAQTQTMTTTYEIHVRRFGSSWSYFLHNRQGVGGGSNGERAKYLGVYRGVRCIKPGETFVVVTFSNGYSERSVRSGTFVMPESPHDAMAEFRQHVDLAKQAARAPAR